MMYKRITALFTVLLMMILICDVPVRAVTFSPDFTITSEAAVMMDLDRNTVVYAKNADKKMYPASLTKIVTAMVVLDNVDDIENTRFEAPLSVFDELYGMGASTVGLMKDEITTVKDLLYSLMLKSACESAGILAYNVGQHSTANFVEMMNEKAKAIGCTGTHFVNPHGLYDKDQFTNANDMARIVRYAVDNYPLLVEIACTVDYEMQPTNMHSEGWAHIYHTNAMINPESFEYYPYVKGFKTGTTDESGRCLATLGSKDGCNYLLVTLGSPLKNEDGETVYNHYEDHRMLYDWAFDHLEYKQIIPADKEVKELQVNFGESSDFVRLVTASDYSTVWLDTIDDSKLSDVITVDESLLNEDGTIDAPVEQGTVLGTYAVTFHDEEVGRVDLVAQTDVTLSVAKYNMDKAKHFVTSGWFLAAAGIAVVLIFLYIILVASSNRKKKKKRRRKKVKAGRNF
ncbi:MAG: D-alanyl-D-alanine carboxypeptidase [Oscillospiraceae bacterium]|nr:D-alanyl-D-alanine carboxypeptidase [Oscillospiraceae bacterium]MBQ8978550.1 D-alanyl-D-alanine carboxypeptidase [Oscillospiraceae bacterium]